MLYEILTGKIEREKEGSLPCSEGSFMSSRILNQNLAYRLLWKGICEGARDKQIFKIPGQPGILSEILSQK